MYYNLELFGEKLKSIRKSLNLNKKELAEMAFIADKTIRRYESGKVMPNFDVLESLSPYYKTDLAALLIQCRFDDYSVFYSIKNKMDLRLYNKSDSDLQKELKELDILLSSAKNKYCINLINQLVVFIKAVAFYNNEKYDLAYDKFIEAMKITTPSFDLDKYNSYIFSSMEIRILMNIGLIINKFKDKDKYLEILEFCINNIECNDEIFPILCSNLAGAYFRIKNYQRALEYSDIGIQFCVEYQNSNSLSNLYYIKGCAEYRLDIKEHVDTLKTSVYLSRAFKQDKLENIIIEKCKKNFDIDLL